VLILGDGNSRLVKAPLYAEKQPDIPKPAAMSGSLFQLPDELIVTTLAQSFPCREAQIRPLATLLYVSRRLSSVDSGVFSF
jgi:hypothetical protein